MLQLSSCRIGYPILGTLPTGTVLGVKQDGVGPVAILVSSMARFRCLIGDVRSYWVVSWANPFTSTCLPESSCNCPSLWKEWLAFSQTLSFAVADPSDLWGVLVSVSHGTFLPESFGTPSDALGFFIAWLDGSFSGNNTSPWGRFVVDVWDVTGSCLWAIFE